MAKLHTPVINKGMFRIPDITLHQYMLIVQPSDGLLERIRRIQRRWTDKFGLTPAQLQSGYLLLARFTAPASQEEKILRKIHYAAMECAPYRISIDGFFGLPDHAAGLKISNPAAVKTINRHIQIQLSEIRFPSERPYYNHFPAIGLANRLQTGQYASIWEQYQHRHFTATFTADHLMVLRKTHDTRRWTMLERFRFENIPVLSKQGVLFA